jgi:hypothetical protein
VPAKRLELPQLVLRRNVPGPGEPGPGEPTERPARPVQVLGEAFGQDAYRRPLEIQRDVAALQSGSQGEGQRRQQLFQSGVGDDRGVPLAISTPVRRHAQRHQGLVRKSQTSREQTSRSTPQGVRNPVIVIKVGYDTGECVTGPQRMLLRMAGRPALPAAFRKLDAVAVLTARLLPALSGGR